MESEPGRSCQPSSAPGLWSQSSSLIYSQGSRGLWCSRTLQKGHQEANETAPPLQASTKDMCPICAGAWGLPELPRGQGLDWGLVGDFRV